MRPYKALQGYFVDPLGTILGRFWGYLAQFDPILNHFGIILESFLGYLEQFWNHLGNIFEFLKKCPTYFGSERLFSLPFEGRPLRNGRFQVGIKKAFLIFEPLKTHFGYPFWDPKLGNKFDQKKKTMNTEAHQELQRPKHSLFKTLKKPSVF